MSSTLTAADLAAVKTRQQATWASGDYAVIGTTLQVVGENLCEAVDVQAGWKVLDVAAGNGNASLAAARRGCDVTATDYVESLLKRAARRASSDGLAIATQVADAEEMPFDDDTFDAVLSTFGVMFTPDHARAGGELVRVARPGGRIGLANWTPESFVGAMLKIVSTHIPPASGVPSPLLWGTEDHLHQMLPDCDVTLMSRSFTFRYRSAQHWFETFRDYYGPINKAWEALDSAGRASLEEQLIALAEQANRAGSGALAVDAEYLEVIASKHGRTREPARS